MVIYSNLNGLAEFRQAQITFHFRDISCTKVMYFCQTKCNKLHKSCTTARKIIKAICLFVFYSFFLFIKNTLPKVCLTFGSAYHASRELLIIQKLLLTFLCAKKDGIIPVFFLAHRKGFEPLYTFLHNTISNRARSTAPPSLHSVYYIPFI